MLCYTKYVYNLYKVGPNQHENQGILFIIVKIVDLFLYSNIREPRTFKIFEIYTFTLMGKESNFELK